MDICKKKRVVLKGLRDGLIYIAIYRKGFKSGVEGGEGPKGWAHLHCHMQERVKEWSSKRVDPWSGIHLQ